MRRRNALVAASVVIAISYHAIRPGGPLFNRDLFIDKIEWNQGWPTVNGGNGPSWQEERHL
jgi:hypothetical protein